LNGWLGNDNLPAKLKCGTISYIDAELLRTHCKVSHQDKIRRDLDCLDAEKTRSAQLK
jgi:hypothetical protein